MDANLKFAGLSSTRVFDDPFLLPSSTVMPETLESALDLCCFLYYLNPQYITANSRIVRHFITDFDYPDGGDNKEQRDFDEFLHYQLQVPLFMAEVGDEWGCYGNGFIRIHFPFDRFLIDPRTHTEYALEFFAGKAKYEYRTMQYVVPDPLKRGATIKLRFRDRISTNLNRIKLRKLNPRFVTIQHNIISGSSRYIYRFEPEIVDDVKKGRLYVVNELPMPMLQAIARNEDYLFDDDAIFHFKAPTISGVSNCGWGIPGTIANFRNIHQLQVYRKIDEAVGLDYMLPFRLFSPSIQGATNVNDLINVYLNARWTDEVATIIKNRRRDKYAMHSLPFPVNYQEFGAQGKELAPKENIELQTQALLDGLGYIPDLFSGNLEMLQIPTTLRLFENNFIFIHIGFNNLLGWASRRIRSYLSLPPMKVRLQRPSIADSIERKQLIFQLASMGEISRETAYDMLGIDDVLNEIKKRLKEDADIEREKLKMQQELQKQMETGALQAPQQDQQGSDPNQAGGQVAAGGGSGPGGATPMDTQSDAESLAQYWMQLDEGTRRNAMAATRNQKPELYALAKQMMEEARRSGESQGRQAVNQQAQQPTQ